MTTLILIIWIMAIVTGGNILAVEFADRSRP